MLGDTKEVIVVTEIVFKSLRTGVLYPKGQECKIFRYKLFDNLYYVFLLINFYCLESYKCFNSELLLAVATIVYINPVEPIIKVTTYCIERNPTVFPQRGSLFEWFSISHKYSEYLKERRACAIIDRVFTCTRKPAYTIHLSITFSMKKT